MKPFRYLFITVHLPLKVQTFNTFNVHPQHQPKHILFSFKLQTFVSSQRIKKVIKVFPKCLRMMKCKLTFRTTSSGDLLPEEEIFTWKTLPLLVFNIFEFQGWGGFLRISEDIYIGVVPTFYSTLAAPDEDNTSLRSIVGSFKF